MGIELVMENAHWFWLSLGGLLLAAEMLGASGYMLWSGLSAVLVGLLTWVMPLGWPLQGTIFAILTIVTALLWWYWLRKRTLSRPQSMLNQRGQQLVGLRTTLTDPVINGFGRVNIGDSSWRVKSEQDLPAGTHVEVIAIDGITLHVRPTER
ncbi:NfeD family protein [Pectobacterium carotovorum]|uniref:NfeD family protein n=1 Tax=Pectobacterium carotovorum TaxID=554 RepID=UPI00057FFBFB|nr:NfeD family protein [Pectobacterium carotovorum]KHT32519.1 membrane protein [Pectobacterium carotovorum subsp. carotovorum]KHT36511.1 membrane protein [Pectobacterium carotovorum subsp. carotovorum]MBL0864961.1 NfeD family protein [Pectobacterium carotovorum]MCQ8231865.1 NfeD family protein [Pectobacterium carotovorum]MDY4375890.1 NfeD family protein [Pectobacterium carotovorum subsp. carotovorum]